MPREWRKYLKERLTAPERICSSCYAGIGGMETDPPPSPLADLRSFLEDLGNEVRIARTLIQDGHPVDLRGLDVQFGLLCAKALDLPTEDGRTLLPDLEGMRSLVDSLIASMNVPAEQD
jgi:hypothetical protein